MKRPVKQINCTPVFWANKEAYDSGIYRRIINQGSSRSSKTYSTVQLLITIALSHKKHISICSPSLPHLKRGARRDFLNIMGDWGLYSDDHFNKTDQVYQFPDKGFIEFFGADDSGKVRGPGRDILFVNEANLLSHETYVQLAMRTREVIFLDFNPADEYNYVYNEIEKPGSKFIHSTYLNNLGNLTKEQVAEIESLKDADPNLWKVYGLGLRGTSSETIYVHWKLIDEWPEVDDFCYGLDFGFNHPTVLMKCGFDDRANYWDEQIYESKLTTDDLIYLLGVNGIPKTKEIFCDSARPEAIEEIRRAGYNAKPAEKAVRDGISFVKSKPLYITRRSANTLKEIKSYKWKVDKEGRVMDEPVKLYDDAMDAGRYGSYTMFYKPKQAWDLLSI